PPACSVGEQIPSCGYCARLTIRAPTLVSILQFDQRFQVLPFQQRLINGCCPLTTACPCRTLSQQPSSVLHSVITATRHLTTDSGEGGEVFQDGIKPRLVKRVSCNPCVYLLGTSDQHIPLCTIRYKGFVESPAILNSLLGSRIKVHSISDRADNPGIRV